MKLIKKDDYYEIFYEPEFKLAEVKWTKNILELLEPEYKNKLLEAYRHLFDLDVRSLLQNTHEAVYPLTEELQAWLTANITKEIFDVIGLKKIAYLIPTDVLTRFGVEQLVDKAMKEGDDIKRMFFDDYDKALEWLKKND